MPAFSHSTSSTQAASVPAAISLPVIERSFPRHLHPYWPKLQEKSRSWLLEKRLMPAGKVERYADDLCYTDLVAGYYIGAPDELLSAIADFSTWFFAWDDRHDRDAVHGRDGAWRQLSERLHAALDAPERYLDHKEPLVAAFAECVTRMLGYLGSDWDARFVAHFHPVIDAYDQEFVNRTAGVTPTVDAYVELRRLTFAHWVWIDLLEPTAGHQLPKSVRENAAYRRAATATQDFSAWYNDLCSLPKELAGEEFHNLGISLIRHQGLSVEEAVVEVRRRVMECVTAFLAAEKEVLLLAEESADGTLRGEETAAGIRSCVFNMRNWFSSVYWFHHESGRYRVDSWDDRAIPPYISEPAGEE